MRWRVALVGLLLLASGGAFAASSSTAVGPAIITQADQWSVWFGGSPAPSTRSWEPNAGGDGVSVVDRATARTPSGKAVDLTVKRGVSNAAIKAGLKTLVKGLIPGLTVAEAIWDMTRDHGIEPGPAGTGVIDPGSPQVLVGGKMIDFRTGEPMTPAAIAARELSSALSQCQAITYGYCEVGQNTSSCNGNTCKWSVSVIHRYDSGTFDFGLGGNDERVEIVDFGCNPSTSTLPVLGTVGPCKTTSRVPVPDNVLDGYVTELPSAQLPELAREVAKGIPAGIPTVDQAPGVFGPPYVDDAPQVTTRPDGTTETTARRWNLEYPGDGTVRFTPRIVETTPDGTTTTEGSPVGATESPTDCDKYPDIIGCSKYGTPEGGQVEKKTKTVSFDPVSLPGGGCPAPRQFVAFGAQYEISWTPICDATVTYVKPVVLIICSAFAAFIFIGGLKS